MTPTQPPEPPFTLEGMGSNRDVEVSQYSDDETASKYGAIKINVPMCDSDYGIETLSLSHRQLATLLSLEDLAVIRHEKERIERFKTPDSINEL